MPMKMAVIGMKIHVILLLKEDTWSVCNMPMRKVAIGMPLPVVLWPLEEDTRIV
jgi:hypothetical protein